MKRRSSLAMAAVGTAALVLSAPVRAQGTKPAPAQAPAPTNAAQPTFRVHVDAVTMDVLVRDGNGNFVPDLTKDDFEVYEDGVKQQIASLTMSHGGRITNVVEAPPPPPPEGVLLPPTRHVTNDASGRIFFFFVDDLNLQVDDTTRVRALFKQIAKELVHQGDLFSMVSSGPSSIEISPTYDLSRLGEAIDKITGHAMLPRDIIQSGQGMHGVAELQHDAQVAVTTVRDALNNLAKIQNRRKVLVWVSDGYDLTPFQDSRLGTGNPNGFYQQNVQNFLRSNQVNSDGTHQEVIDPTVEAQRQADLFTDSDFDSTLRRLTDQANRANTTIYTLDPRGLVAAQSIDEQVDPTEWRTSIVKQQETMRDIAERTGGEAVVDDNNFTGALKRIDAEASDYYMIGYYSNNPNPTSGRHRIEVKVTRPGLTVQSRTEYVDPPPSRPTAAPAAAAPAPSGKP
jgi:VWFA-related protein